MKFSQRALSVLSVSFLSLMAAVPVLAAPAYLVGEFGSRINVRSQPTTFASSPHFGLVGDRVEVIDITYNDEDGYEWYYVEFASGARGWIRGDLVEVQEP
ncbi:MAG: SH3 domain-containing protein [Acaryochloridaceae cyanobacterium SU_2_1]|nr:SH3 domain-containing protein [Acaryochloridaceae cyanobacterium SU_2_1]